MKIRWMMLMCCLLLSTASPVNGAITITIDAKASSVERSVTQELADNLRKIYPAEKFVVADKLPDSGKCILIGNARNGLLPVGGWRMAAEDLPKEPDSFRVKVIKDARRELAVIAGADPRGAAYGVYAVLEKLGCGFYLSYDALPAPRQEPFSFDGWDMSDAPLVKDRVVFDWHNFLSGCSTWNLDDWNRWTLQAQKMRYNGIMVHAYGNNPMVRFSLGGVNKPIGYLSTTLRGRDWSTNHASDVRRLFGGDAFDSPVFGADAAKGPEDQRGPAAEKMMRQVFDFAAARGMDVVFADDVDTISANPQEIILKLPEAARFAIQDGKFWLVNPQTREGYEYYKAQVRSLMTTYPTISKLVVWFRNGGTPWMDLKLTELPKDWQDEYRSIVAKTPEAEKYWKSVSMFAIGKIVTAFDRALIEIGRKDVELCAGTWNFMHLPGADVFNPKKIKLYGLDYAVLHGKSQLDTPENRRFVRDVAEHRPVVPVTWAHHDDGTYVGRSFTPYTDFHAKLKECGASGFGIIHWTTRPLDLYFASLARQVWKQSENQPVQLACEEMAERSFGPSARQVMGKYLYRWITEAPIFGRETSDRFIDRELKDVEQVVAGCNERLTLIGQVDQSKLLPEQKARLDFHKGLERFITDFWRAHDVFQKSQELAKKGDWAGAIEAIARCDAPKVIEQFRQFSGLGGITRGEQGLIVSLNLRWLAHIVAHRQWLGLDPMQYRFAPTSHDPLAQSPGWMTFHFEPDRRIWQCLGEKEMGVPVFVLPENVPVQLPQGARPSLAEICRSGIETDKPLTLQLGPIFSKAPRPLRPGKYQLTLLMIDPTSTAADQRVFDVRIAGSDNADRIDLFKSTGQPNSALIRSYPVEIRTPGPLSVTLTPVRGKAIICGAVLEPKN